MGGPTSLFTRSQATPLMASTSQLCVDTPVLPLPLFSQDASGKKVPADKLMDLDKRVQDAGTEVVNAKGGKGSATLSMAYAGSRFGSAVLRGLAGEDTIECAYVQSDVVEGMNYFSSKVTFGENGVKQVHPLGPMTEREQK